MRYWNIVLSLWPFIICSYTSSPALLSLAKELEAKIVTWVCLMIAPVKWVTLAKVSGQFFRALFWCPLPLPAVKGTRIIFSLMERSISTSTSPLPKCPPYPTCLSTLLSNDSLQISPFSSPCKGAGTIYRWMSNEVELTVQRLNSFCSWPLLFLTCAWSVLGGKKSRQF